MNVQQFAHLFGATFDNDDVLLGTVSLDAEDPCPDVPGMCAPKNQKLLQIAYSCLPESEGYLEIGTANGRSLISAMLGNPPRKVFACDNFSQFQDSISLTRLQQNLVNYGLAQKVMFYDADFMDILNKEKVPVPIGLYYYDAEHSFASQYAAIKRAEHLLADEALVIVDDWRLAPDSGSRAIAGTNDAIAESIHTWTTIYELPARSNLDLEMWWNGVGILGFQRREPISSSRASYFIR